MNTYGLLRNALKLLSNKARTRYLVFSFIQLFSSLLDLIAVSLIGATTFIISTKTQSHDTPPALIRYFRNFFPTQKINDNSQTLWLILIAVFLFILKSFLTLMLTRKLSIFLANQTTEISSSILKRYLNQPITFITKNSFQKIIQSVIIGVNSSVLGSLSSISIIFSELGLLLILIGTLMFINFQLTFYTTVFFVFFFTLFHLIFSKIAVQIGKQRIDTDVKSFQMVEETIYSYRELFVSNKVENILQRFIALRNQNTKAFGDGQWVLFVPKYSMESALMLGIATISLYLYYTNQYMENFSTLTMFIAAGSRILPSILRIQSAIGAIQSGIGSASYTFNLIEEISKFEKTFQSPQISNLNLEKIKSDKPEFSGTILLQNVSYKYPDSSQSILKNVDFEISKGTKVAIVGKTGSGKSTLADIMMGLINPSEGTVSLSGLPPSVAIKIWPGKMAYVPQVVSLTNISVKENVALGEDLQNISEDKVWECLKIAKVDDLVLHSTHGLETLMGEFGSKLSAGQKQRIGLARALYSDPKLLILDEATSALDVETENAISQSLESLPDDITVITIAHRLSTVKNARYIIHVQAGNIMLFTSFSELIQEFPSFELQMKLSGLSNN